MVDSMSDSLSIFFLKLLMFISGVTNLLAIAGHFASYR